MTIRLSQVGVVSVGATRWHDIDFSSDLRGSDTIASVATPDELVSSDLTITSTAVNAAALEINGKTVAIGKAVSMKITGQKSGTTYVVLFSITTTGGEIIPYEMSFIGD